MKLPAITKILREDVKDAPEWITKIIGPFNSLAENVYQAFNKSLTDTENLACFIKDITYKTTSLYPLADTVEFLNELKFKATGLQVLQAVDRTTYQPAAGPVYAPWVEDNGKILVSAITGLEADKIYTIRLRIS